MDEDKNTLNDKIAEDLGLNYDESVPAVVQKADVIEYEEEPETDQQLDSDFESSRRTLEALEFEALSAIKEFQQIAKESQSARSYEVIANLLKTTADIAKDRIDIHGKKRKIKDADPSPNSGSTINANNANIIVASSSDMLKQIKNDKENE